MPSLVEVGLVVLEKIEKILYMYVNTYGWTLEQTDRQLQVFCKAHLSTLGEQIYVRGLELYQWVECFENTWNDVIGFILQWSWLISLSLILHLSLLTFHCSEWLKSLSQRKSYNSWWFNLLSFYFQKFLAFYSAYLKTHNKTSNYKYHNLTWC